MTAEFTVGVLALQGAFIEHVNLLKAARNAVSFSYDIIEVRTVEELNKCSALIIPGGESTTISLVAQRTGLLEPLREFVKVQRKPTWGTCAGMILLSEQANRTKKGGQELIGGLDVRINRNQFGGQQESFETFLDLDFIDRPEEKFPSLFIRAPIVESLLPGTPLEDAVSAPGEHGEGQVKALVRLPKKTISEVGNAGGETTDIVAVQQANVVGMSFHPELSSDFRMHQWWVEKCVYPAIKNA
ncbi:SNO glutamine amidotransferase [Saitoella complicata NRRL Y-17804]|nr:SNO glutamine amidotransferase [Saitoella complicata NRRL Y-17804]ODQ55588.1 SNO glutamine amidotransferase [Saitoella complicata NRRL Y-17804]